MNAVLVITPMDRGSLKKRQRPLIVEFDPSKESQEEVELRYGASFSEYYVDRAHAVRALAMVASDCF